MFNTLIQLFGTREKAYIVIGCGIALIILITTIVYFCASSIINSLKSKTVSKRFQEQNEKLIEDMLRIKETNVSVKGFYDGIENLLAQSQVKYKFHFNIYYFCLFTLEFAAFGAAMFYSMLGTPVLAILGFIAGSLLPFTALSIVGGFMGREIKKQILTLIPILINNAKLKRGDVFLTIKESAKKVKPPMSYYLAEFVGEFESGIEIETCFENLRNKVNDGRFLRLVDVLEIHMNRGGNVVTSLNNLQKEFLSREIEEDRHKKESFSNTLGIYICVAANFFIVWLMAKIMPEILSEMKSASFEIYLLVAGINILISIFIAIKSTKVGATKDKRSVK